MFDFEAIASRAVCAATTVAVILCLCACEPLTEEELAKLYEDSRILDAGEVPVYYRPWKRTVDYVATFGPGQKECRAPAVARVSKSFKYGCFCGNRHPNILFRPGMSDVEQRKFALEWLRSVKPHDQIDFLCKLHDMCFALNGFVAGCNIKFRDALLAYDRLLDGRYSNETAANWHNIRCGNLALAIAQAIGSSVVPGNTQGPVEVFGSVLSDATAAVISPLYALIYGLSNAKPFPEPGSSCN
jgi:hypothetical protein